MESLKTGLTNIGQHVKEKVAAVPAQGQSEGQRVMELAKQGAEDLGKDVSQTVKGATGLDKVESIAQGAQAANDLGTFQKAEEATRGAKQGSA